MSCSTGRAGGSAAPATPGQFSMNTKERDMPCRPRSPRFTLLTFKQLGLGALFAALPALASAQAAEPPSINQADTSWMLISTALVLLMTPALAFFYGGLV